ncbi:class I SAM-dependent methyltransferase [Xanthomonas perforans]|uniref:site-specific DNA-methyltransferase (adenine-specific) n=1 Tax=Xanthomonas perforans TaxID=442694 RepID=A0A6P0FI59_XANPE|nr:class I SAM-dependent methyltransferase [Xanthomonas perforans]MBZ2602348.1 N-6 DNA methylase [Xanthomonas perforans]MBZ2745397.1 N-6 DNA methylase [Xanthomonas perforans]MBZ3073157.1 N-6 DNA methylase [Xanthomonas perforans]MBZ3141140.1 N-6 DNA methylase [Xanthomonas perforans]MBZ3150050.1 N-6 DNA methylase [Xanthomonas perforans]
MSSPGTLEQARLRAAATQVREFSSQFKAKQEEARFQLLEAVAARLGSHDIAAFQGAFGRALIAPAAQLDEVAGAVLARIRMTGIESALALSALSREALTVSKQKSTGAYHTDFRLAQRLAKVLAPSLTAKSKVIDPASGSGILLVALTLAVCGNDRRMTARWLRNGVHAMDLSDSALRGATLSLAALTDDLGAVVEMRRRWRSGDSLALDAAEWERMAPRGFDAIIANPPWEKVRLTKHEFLVGKGASRHYGSDLEQMDRAAFEASSGEVKSYAEFLVRRFPLLVRGEPDLYAAFMALYLNLLRPGGQASVLVPGGLIRSQGTQALREALFDRAERLEVGVFDNRARFFGIDTRFKFLALNFTQHDGAHAKEPIQLTRECGTEAETEVLSRVRIGRKPLRAVRPDLSVPEVHSNASWALFQRLVERGERMGDPLSPWFAEFCREVDMTGQRSSFTRYPRKGQIGVIEGRHVQQHRFGAKAYVAGSGRSAVWESRPLGGAEVVPQFYIAAADCPAKAQERIQRRRVGFCDIAGQTNERSMMAALVEPGYVCGNKVPTVCFPNDPDEDRLFVWLAVVNSLTFDWMLRRVLTTSINYFVLLGIPMPSIKPKGLPWRRLATAARALHDLNLAARTPETDREAAALRTRIEVEVARAYSVTLAELDLMSSDFPLLDRGQPSLEQESRSTITWDSVLAGMSGGKDPWQRRMVAAQAAGAIAFVPAQHSGFDPEDGGTYGAERGEST